jgi:hypothetical protein
VKFHYPRLPRLMRQQPNSVESEVFHKILSEDF